MPPKKAEIRSAGHVANSVMSTDTATWKLTAPLPGIFITDASWWRPVRILAVIGWLVAVVPLIWASAK